MMKLGQLYLADGVWKGRRLVDSVWIKEAVSKKIDTGETGGAGKTENDKNNKHAPEDIWRCGYGYQFWMSPYGSAYRADGAFGQITTVLPEKGCVISIQCPENGNFDWVKKELHERVLTQI